MAGFECFAQTDDKSYYEPYNFPDSYELDESNKQLRFEATIAPFWKGDYALHLYSDAVRVKLTEFMNINAGWGGVGGFTKEKEIVYEMEGHKAYDLTMSYYGKALIGAGVNFRLFNPFNFSFHAGFSGGYEEYSIKNVRPAKHYDEWHEFKYLRKTVFPVRIGYFTDLSLIVKLGTVGISATWLNMPLADRVHNNYYLGVALPLGD